MSYLIQAANVAASPAMTPAPVTLTGRHVRLEPLGPAHAGDLLAAAAEPEIWRYLPVAPPRTAAEMDGLIAAARADAAAGRSVPFAIVDLRTGRAVGSTRYLDLAPEHRRLEIGWTWLGASARRTPVNTEAKLLLLTHAFEVLGCNRVQLKTDARNERSQTAIARIGGVREGVWRRHMVMPDGHVRDTMMFSIIAGEWPAVKARLEARLGRGSV